MPTAAPLKSLTIGDRTFPVAELRLGALRRIPELAAALTTMMQVRLSASEMAFPSASQLDAMLTILHASASSVDPTITREQMQGAVDDCTLAGGFTLITECAYLAMGRTQEPMTEGASSGEAASP